MTDHRLEGPGENGEPVPRDMPDQQADTGEDPWEVAPRFTGTGEDDGAGKDHADESADDVPDTDEAGTGRRGEVAATGHGAPRASGAGRARRLSPLSADGRSRPWGPAAAIGCVRARRLCAGCGVAWGLGSAHLVSLHRFRPRPGTLLESPQELLQHLRRRVFRPPAEFRTRACAVHQGQPQHRVEQVR